MLASRWVLHSCLMRSQTRWLVPFQTTGIQSGGRGHPLMLISVVPLCISLYMLFDFPDGLSAPLQLGWLLTFPKLVRTCLTLFQVPYTALGAEMSTDYTERSKAFSYRTLFGWFCGEGFTIFAYNILFASTPEYRNGLLNPAAYPKLALTAILLMSVGTIVCIGAKFRVGANLPPPVNRTRFTISEL